uniref:hypothetical protein n=1 Tax=Pseudarthrobacter sp. MEB009 TaxID=3040326 RepID=UPI00255678DE
EKFKTPSRPQPTINIPARTRKIPHKPALPGYRMAAATAVKAGPAVTPNDAPELAQLIDTILAHG